MSQIGRIGGPLLEADLLRNGVDLAFRDTLSTTQLLYIDVNNRRIGVNLNNPSYELDIFGTTRTVNLLADELALPNYRIENNEINIVLGDINLDAQEAIVLSNLETAEFSISDNRINTLRSNANIDLVPNGTGTVDIFNNLNVYGNLNATGNITLGGTITFGNNQTIDTVDFNTDVSSDIIPDQTLTYRLGNSSKRWNELYTDLVNGTALTVSSISVGGTDLSKRTGNIFYVSVNGNDTNVGDHPQGPFATIKRALDAADASNGGPVTVFVYPGEYQEQLPLVVPSNVSIIGEGIRSVTIEPANGYETEDVFHLNGETTVQHLTVKNFYYDNINNTGHAFRFAPNAIITSRSPYIQNVSVITNTGIVIPRQITPGPGPTLFGYTSNSFNLDKTFYSQGLVDSLVGQTAVIDRYPNAPLFYTVVSIETEPFNTGLWRVTVDTTFNTAGYIKPISFYSNVDPTLIITNNIWDTSGSSVGEKWVAYFKSNLPANFETTVQPGWTIHVAGTIYTVDYIIQDPVNSNQWRIYVTTSLVGGTGIPIFSSPTTSTTLLAGRGAWIDGSEMNSASVDASMLFHSCTFITPDADAITMTNGVRVEWLNSFTYFANRGLYAVDGVTGRTSQDGSTTIYGAEVRSIGSANVYGNYGAVADGPDTLMYLIGHNFGYIGSGLDSSNDKSLAIQTNEAVELNSGKIYYNSTDHLGNFRVGDNFFVDFETGTTSIDTSNITFGGLAVLQIGAEPNFTTITADKIDTGNIRIAGNTVETLVGDINFNSFSDIINLNSNVSITKNLALVGNFNFDGSLNLFGNAYTDTVDLNVDIDQNFNPNLDTTYNLGSLSNQWKTAWLSQADIDGVRIFDNVVTTTASNSNLELRANGTGSILIPNNNVTFSNDLTVAGNTVTNSTDIENLNLNGNIFIGGNSSVQSQTISGYLDVSKSVQFEEIKIDDNVITTTSSNTNLELRAEPAGIVLIPSANVVINNNLSVGDITNNSNIDITNDVDFNFADVSDINIVQNYITTNNGNLDLDLRATGDVVVPSNNIVVEQNLTVNGDTSLQSTTVIGIIDQLGSRTQTGNYSQTGNLNQTGNITIESAVQFADVLINDNVITTTIGNNDLDLRASGTGNVLVPYNDVIVNNNLFAATITTGDIIIDQDLNLDDIVVRSSNIQINDNYITTSISNSDLELRATGDVVVPTNNVVVEQNLTVNGDTDLENTSITGTLIQVGNRTQTGNYNQTGNVIVDGDFRTFSDTQIASLRIVDNFITTRNLNENLVLEASGTGTINFNDSLSITRNLSARDLVTGNLTINNSFALEAMESSTDIQIFDNVITTTNSNSNLELRTNGTGDIRLESVFVNGSALGTRTGNLTLEPTENLIINSSGAFRISRGTTAQRSNTQGDLRFNTTDNVFEARGSTSTITFNGVYSSDRRTSLTAHPTNNTLNLTVNTTQVGTVNSSGLSIHAIDVDDLFFNANSIVTNVSNSDLELRTDGTGELLVEEFTLKSNVIAPTTTGAAFRLGGTGIQWVVFEGNLAVKFPSGDTASRPLSPVLGQTRHNTDTDELETWIGDQWRASAGQFDAISEAQMEDEAFIQTLIYG